MNKKYQVFISSTFVDLVEERNEVTKALLELDCIPVGMEYFPTSAESSTDYIRQAIYESDYFIMLLAGRYGSLIDDSGTSFMELEYNHARQTKKPILIFIKNASLNSDENVENINKLNTFKKHLLENHLCSFFDSASDLGSLVVKKMIQIIKTNPSTGWVRDADDREGSEFSKQTSENSINRSIRKTFLLTFNPAKHPTGIFKEEVTEFQEKGTYVTHWSVGNKGISKGDRVFFMRHGSDNPGLFGAGQVISDPFENRHWDKESPNDWRSKYAEIRWDFLSELPIVPLNLLNKEIGESDLWTRNGSGHLIPVDTAERLEKLWHTRPENKALNNSSELGPTSVEDISSEDCLGRASYTNALVQLLTVRDDTRPFTIGLFGQWGSGKSSQIAQLKAHLQTTTVPSIRVTEFNAWAHERATNIAAALAQTIVETLVDKLSFADQIKLAAKLSRKRRTKTIEALERDRLRFWVLILETWSIWSPAAVAIIMLAFSLYLFSQSNVGKGIILVIVAIPPLLSTYFGSSHFIMKNLTGWFKKFNFSKQVDKFRLPDYSSHLGLYHEIKKNLEHLCDLRISQDVDAKKGEYLLVVVDDLDRCGPEMVKQVFDAVRLVAHIPRVITLVAIDERMAFSAVEQYYDKLGHAGREPALVARDYLAKVFQVAINLPKPNDSHIRNYVSTKLFTNIINVLPPDEVDPSSSGLESKVEKSANTSMAPNPKVQVRPNNTAPVQSATISASNYTIRGEKELFIRLAIVFSFSNPRLLWRLMQSWRLLKSIVLLDTYHLETAEPWLRLLFWREWLFQQDSETRKNCHELPISESSTYISPRIIDALPKNIGLDDYRQKCGNIDAVLLPATPTKIGFDNVDSLASSSLSKGSPQQAAADGQAAAP